MLDDHFRSIDTKRLIDVYEKASGNSDGVADLLITAIACACAALENIGGDYEKLIDAIYSLIGRLDATLRRVEPPATELTDRLTDLAEAYDGSFGYGLSDEIVGCAQGWSVHFSKRAAALGSPVQRPDDFDDR